MERSMEPVTVEEIRQDAICVITRVGLGSYEVSGPQGNILVPESRVAWATVVHDLQGEGYRLVTLEEYAETAGIGFVEAGKMVHEKGSLFALAYGESLVVPLPEREAVLPRIET